MAGELNLSLMVQVAQFLVTGGIGVYLYMERKNDRTNVRIDEMETRTDDRLDELSERLAHVEGELRNSIGKPDIERVHGRIDALDKTLSRLDGAFAGIADNVRMILNRIADKGMS